MEVHMVIHSFLLAEFESPKNPWKKDHIKHVMKATCPNIDIDVILSIPDFTSAHENAARYRALMSIRRDTWFNLPPDTIWERVLNFDVNIKNIILLSPKEEKDLKIHHNRDTVDINGIILWYQGGIYYVLEGNHRISQYRMNEMKYIPKYVYVGKEPFRLSTGHASVLGKSITEMDCPLINKGKKYAEKNVANHWSELYEGDINPDKELYDATLGI